MIGSDLVDEIDCCSFFDQIDDLIEFPADNECGLGSGSCGNDFPSIWSNPPPDCLPGPDPIFSGNSSSNGTSDLSAQLSVPYEDMVQLEWLSNFVEDSFTGGGMTLGKENSSIHKESPSSHNQFQTSIHKDSSSSHNQFQTSSPISVLESSSSSSCSEGKTMPLSTTQHGPQRVRSKRPRPTTFSPRPAIPHIFPTCSFKKKKKIKMLPPLGGPSPPGEMNQNPPPQAVRKCMHCEVTKTPQWRAGPMGPKTLCNACGVRYKSGRLFPEYRPAASPTFVPSLHSNSHKKVLEMRIKGGGGEKSPISTTVMAMTATTQQPEFIPNSSNPSLAYI